MDKTKLEHLDEAIRHSLEEECSVRNSRTNWFLAFQAALGGGIFQLLLSYGSNKYSPYLLLLIDIIGIVTSISFWYAAWRSDKAVSMLLAFWDELRDEANLRIKDAYPVIPLTNGILENHFNCCCDNKNFEDFVFEHKLATRMGLKNFDKWKNQWDVLMPYRIMPIVFFWCWLILPLFYYIHSCIGFKFCQ